MVIQQSRSPRVPRPFEIPRMRRHLKGDRSVHVRKSYMCFLLADSARCNLPFQETDEIVASQSTACDRGTYCSRHCLRMQIKGSLSQEERLLISPGSLTRLLRMCRK